MTLLTEIIEEEFLKDQVYLELEKRYELEDAFKEERNRLPAQIILLSPIKKLNEVQSNTLPF